MPVKKVHMVAKMNGIPKYQKPLSNQNRCSYDNLDTVHLKLVASMTLEIQISMSKYIDERPRMPSGVL